MNAVYEGGFFSRGNMAEILGVTFDTALNNWLKGPFVIIGAITAEKLEGTSRGVDANPVGFPPRSLPRLPLLLRPGFTHSLPYSSFLLHLNSARRSLKAL